jgi:thioredoxin reductase
MLFDCAIIGGGPAGLNAALVLGRARRNVILFDSNKPIVQGLGFELVYADTDSVFLKKNGAV